MSQNINVNQVENPLNKNAKEYVPTKIRNKERKMFDPNFIQFIEDVNDEAEEDEKDVQEKMDMIEKDIIEEEAFEEFANDLSEDEDMWLPRYKDCECCKGFVFKCNGKTCADLGQCYCKMKDECDKKLDKK